MKFEFKTEVVPYEPKSAFERKWGLTGRTSGVVIDGKIKVQVQYSTGLPSQPGVMGDFVGRLSSIQTALGHEIGHSTQVAKGAKRPSKMSNQERFEFEVQAWLIEFPLGALSYVDATLMLDALNTYRRGYEVNDVAWQDARVRVEQLCDSEAIREYVPIEPDPNDEMPCMGVGGYDPEAEDGDESDGGEDEGESKGGDDGADDEVGGSGSPKPDEQDKSLQARDEWLHSQEGVNFTSTAKHWNHFRNHMLKHWGPDGVKDLPAVTRALLKSGGAR